MKTSPLTVSEHNSSYGPAIIQFIGTARCASRSTYPCRIPCGAALMGCGMLRGDDRQERNAESRPRWSIHSAHCREPGTLAGEPLPSDGVSILFSACVFPALCRRVNRADWPLVDSDYDLRHERTGVCAHASEGNALKRRNKEYEHGRRYNISLQDDCCADVLCLAVPRNGLTSGLRVPRT